MGLQGKSFCLALAAITLLSFNMCFLEEVAAGPLFTESASHHESPATGYHHAEDSKPETESSCGGHEKSESPCDTGKIVCCEDIVAVQPSVNPSLVRYDVFESVYLATESFRLESAIKHPHYEYHIDFSPGASPPTSFLLSNTNHAPPLHA